MPKLSFSAPAEETVTAPAPKAAAPVKDTVAEVVPPQAIVPVESRAPATLPDTYFEDDDASGEINNSRYDSHPNLKIVSKTSAGVEEFGIGAWIVGSKTVEPTAIGKMDKPIKTVCLKMSLAWQEQVTYGEQRIPKLFATLAEAQAQGFYAEWGMEPRVAEVLKALFWIPQPEGVDEPFIFSYEGPEGPGALAFFFAARTAFGTVGKSLIQAKRSFLATEKGGMVAGWWELSATKAARNGNTWLLPRVRPCGKTSPELQEFLKGLR